MAATGITRFPVVDRDDPGRLVGTISLNNLLSARVVHLENETRREKVLQLPSILAMAKARAAREKEEAGHAEMEEPDEKE